MLTAEKQYIVVSGDRDIQAYAWSHNSIPINAEDFLNALEGDAEKDNSIPPCPKHTLRGNPKMPSKKDKAQKRAISKL